MKRIVLASKSIDRGNLLHSAQISFDFLVTDIDENSFKQQISDPIKLVQELAKAKAKKAKSILLEQNRTDTIIIAADTIVEFEGEIIGKPRNKEDAFNILKRLQGKKHTLITGVAITETSGTVNVVTYDTTVVKFLNLNDDEIWKYLDHNEWKGRAGAYSIKDKASLFVEHVEGSPTNVVGLPISKIYEILKIKFNLELL